MYARSGSIDNLTYAYLHNMHSLWCERTTMCVYLVPFWYLRTFGRYLEGSLCTTHREHSKGRD